MCFLEWVLLNRAPSSTQLHPAFCNNLNNIWTKILHVIGQFPQIQTEKLRSVHFENWHTWYIGGFDSESRLLGKFAPKNSKLTVLPENWCTQYLKDADSKSRLRFLKFPPQNPFLGKSGPKKSKMSALSENWYTWYIKHADSYSNISFLNFKS